MLWLTVSHGSRALISSLSRRPHRSIMSKQFTLNTGANIPAIGFGTGTALYKKNAESLVRLAIDNGITHLDGAQMYENEESLAAGVKSSGRPRSELFITTKLNGLKPDETIAESLKASLSRLGLEYVDLFLIHDPSRAPVGELPKWWAAMEEVYYNGLAKAVGVSNFTVGHLNEILTNAKIVPAANQIELHPYVWNAAEPIVKLCQERGIVVESYGGLTPVARVSGGPLDLVLESIRSRIEGAFGKPVSAGQVLTKWLLQKEVVVVTTSTKAERIRGFLDTQNIPDLTQEEIDAIEEAGSKLHKRIFMGHVFA